jgi:hypothetical protein
VTVTAEVGGPAAGFSVIVAVAAAETAIAGMVLAATGHMATAMADPASTKPRRFTEADLLDSVGAPDQAPPQP